nr:MAG TPA_asm: hypothetical protein [Bacteriophage sp.]
MNSLIGLATGLLKIKKMYLRLLIRMESRR